MTAHLPSKLRKIGALASGVAFAALLTLGMAGVAQADPWHDHEIRARRWHEHPVPVAPVVYAPPVVYTAPPEPAGLSLVFPLNFR